MKKVRAKNSTIYICPYCNKEYRRRDSFELHVQKCRLKGFEKLQQPNEEPRGLASKEEPRGLASKEEPRENDINYNLFEIFKIDATVKQKVINVIKTIYESNLTPEKIEFENNDNVVDDDISVDYPISQFSYQIMTGIARLNDIENNTTLEQCFKRNKKFYEQSLNEISKKYNISQRISVELRLATQLSFDLIESGTAKILLHNF